MTHATKHHGAELELDPLLHAEPMKFIVENVSQSAVVLPCFGDDTSRSVELVCDGFRRLGEHGVAPVSIASRQRLDVNGVVVVDDFDGLGAG